MKKFLFILCFCLISCIASYAQDKIFTKNGEQILAKITEITDSSVKYKLFSEINGPTYIIPKYNLTRIVFQSGREEFYNYTKGDEKNSYELRKNMSYRELRKIYNPDNYISNFHDPYNPFLSGVMSFIVPGMGQMLCGETGRGFTFFGTYMASLALGYTAVLSMAYTNGNIAMPLLGITALSTALSINIWSIFDAVKVAKIKDMYITDLRKNHVINMNIKPAINYTYSPNGVQPSLGLKLAMNF